jgi:arylsulfatase A-like enzyme
VPAHATLFGGRYPSELGVYAKVESLTCDEPVLAEHLSDEGYTTRGFSANANISKPFSFDRGFDEFAHSWRGEKSAADVFDWGDFISKHHDEGPTRFLRALYRCVVDDVNTVKSLEHGVKLKARDMGIERIAGEDAGSKQLLSSLRETEFGDREFFFANLMEAHGPYDPPADYRTTDYTSSPDVEDTIGELDYDGDPATIRQAYDDSVAYLSDVYRDIFAELRESFDYVVTLGDHGEMFGRDGVWAHNHGIYPELVHVPLHVYRGQEEDIRSDAMVNLFDVHRTVLDLAGRSDAPSRGENLLESPASRSFLVERFGLRSERIEQLHETGHSTETTDRYDTPLRGIAIPPDYYGWETLEEFPEEGTTPEDDPRERLDALADELDVPDVSERSESDVPADVLDRLEELGYV